jgi:hypothetical protein
MLLLLLLLFAVFIEVVVVIFVVKVAFVYVFFSARHLRLGDAHSLSLWNKEFNSFIFFIIYYCLFLSLSWFLFKLLLTKGLLSMVVVDNVLIAVVVMDAGPQFAY